MYACVSFLIETLSFFFSFYRHTRTTVDSNTWSLIGVKKFRQERADNTEAYNAISIIRSCVCQSFGNRT